MSHFNECSQLISGLEEATQKYNETIAQGKDPFQLMLEMQKALQINLANNKSDMNPHPDQLETAGQVLDWLQYQSDCIQDETRELYTALGGMSNGDRQASAVWKRWKADNLKYRSQKISDMSPGDRLEIQFEMIDIMHFVMCQMMVLGIDSKTLFELYYLKNKENFNRWENGY